MAFHQLCEDMKTEIFSRTSLNTLFAIYNWQLSFNESSLSHVSNTIDDLGFLPYNFRILTSSSEKGIMVFESPDPRTHGLFRYYVSNPFTKQILALPNPKTKYLTQKVAIIMAGLHFKILRLSLPNNFYNAYYCEIFDSETWAWRALDLVKLPSYVYLTDTRPIATRGSVNFLLTNNDILEVDVFSEKWRMFSCPIPTLEYAGYFTLRHLVKYEGKLGFVCKPLDGCWEIWVFKKDESWEKMYVFDDE